MTWISNVTLRMQVRGMCFEIWSNLVTDPDRRSSPRSRGQDDASWVRWRFDSRSKVIDEISVKVDIPIPIFMVLTSLSTSTKREDLFDNKSVKLFACVSLQRLLIHPDITE